MNEDFDSRDKILKNMDIVLNSEPGTYSQDYIRNYMDRVDSRYESVINDAIMQFARKQIDSHELGRIVSDAILEYNRSAYELIKDIDRFDESELAHVEFDSNIKEQLRVQRSLNAKGKHEIEEREAQQRQNGVSRKEQQNERDILQLELERAKTDLYRQRLNAMDDVTKEKHSRK